MGGWGWAGEQREGGGGAGGGVEGDDDGEVGGEEPARAVVRAVDLRVAAGAPPPNRPLELTSS